MNRVDEVVEMIRSADGERLDAALRELIGLGSGADPAAAELLELVHRSADRGVRMLATEALAVAGGPDGWYVRAAEVVAETGLLQREAAEYARTLDVGEARRAIENHLWAMGDCPQTIWSRRRRPRSRPSGPRIRPSSPTSCGPWSSGPPPAARSSTP